MAENQENQKRDFDIIEVKNLHQKTMTQAIKQKIMCITRWDLEDLWLAQEGFSLRNESSIKLIESRVQWHERCPGLENDTSIKQIIPQVLLAHDDRLIVHQVPETGAEQRLHGKWPIFFGGHIEQGDESIHAAMLRELREEVLIPPHAAMEYKFLGLVNLETPDDDRSKVDVCQVHIGGVWAARCLDEKVIFRPTKDDGVHHLTSVTWGEAEQMLGIMTPWSQTCFPVLRSLYKQGKI